MGINYFLSPLLHHTGTGLCQSLLSIRVWDSKP